MQTQIGKLNQAHTAHTVLLLTDIGLFIFVGCNVMFPYMYTSGNDQITVISISIISGIHHFSEMTTLKILPRSSFEKTNTSLLTAATLLSDRAPELVSLTMTLCTGHPVSPTPLHSPPGSHCSTPTAAHEIVGFRRHLCVRSHSRSFCAWLASPNKVSPSSLHPGCHK